MAALTALGVYYRRIARHKGAGLAVFATVRKLAILVCRMPRYGRPYSDIGEAPTRLPAPSVDSLPSAVPPTRLVTR